MKKITMLLSLALLITLSAAAQKDKRAQGILDAMSNRYKALKSYEAAFTYTGGKESYKGNLIVKNEKFRLLLGDQEVMSDGKTMSTYMKESNEVNMQDYDESSTGDLNPTQIYSLYKRGYNYKFVKEHKQNGRRVDVIELTPNTAKSAIATIQISVDKADKSIRSWAIVGKDGKRTTYTITKFVPNVDAPDPLFIFNKAKHPGVEVVDLR